MRNSTQNLEVFRERLATEPLREVDGKWYFREADLTGETTDSFDWLKLVFKKFPRFYYFGPVISSFFSDQRAMPIEKEVIES